MSAPTHRAARPGLFGSPRRWVHHRAHRRAYRVLGRPDAPTGAVRAPRPWFPVLLAAGLGGLAGLLLDSAVAGVVVAGYAALGRRLWTRHRLASQAARCRAEALDLLGAYAADLRAGAQRSGLLLPETGLDRMARAAQRLAERTGAPLADLLDRLEQQCRAGDRADAAARAQAAGSQLTALMLAGLPLGGIGLGYLIGVDPLDMLLHTPLGAACAGTAALLQAGGLLWAQRITRVAGAAATPTRTRNPGRRLRRLGPERGTERSTEPASPPRARLAAVIAGLAVLALLPNVVGLVLAPALGCGVLVGLRRIEPAGLRAARLRALAELPFAADLLAAALSSGAPVDAGLLAVADALDGPISLRLNQIGRSLRLGASPAQAWQHLADLPAAHRLIAAADRSSRSGAALAGGLLRCADDLRADAAVTRQAGAQRAGVLIVLPLGLCFLPAFVLAGLVPVVLAVLGEVL